MSTTSRFARRSAFIAVALAVGLAACGSDDAASDTDTDTAPAATAAPEGTAAAGTDSPPDGAFPVTIEHAFGETTIDAEPQRVVSIGFAEHDNILALGVTPIAVRDWYGDQPFATWPWAQDELGDAEPEVLAAAALNFEQIATLDPDLIIGVNSGMSDTDYATLSQIAPTIARPADSPDYGTPWRDQLDIIATALGRQAEAAEVRADVEAAFAAVREEHPEFEGQTAAVSFTFEELPGAYASGDGRAQMLAEMGFDTPAEFDELAGDEFYFTVSSEELAVLDQDVIVWIVSDAAGYAAVNTEALRPTLVAYTEGREVIADPLLSSAFSHGSALSLAFVIEELVGELALAVDGDPSTVVPSMALLEEQVAAQDGAGGDFTAEEQSAADAWALVFDSTVAFADKADHLQDANALQATVEGYEAAGAAMGGITLAPTAVAIDGVAATITYDVNFGAETAYSALEGEMTLVDGSWIVGHDEFCSFMASARNACPA